MGCAAQGREQNLPRGASLGPSLVLPECVERPLPTLLQLLSPYRVPDTVFHAGDTRWVRLDAREPPVGRGDGQGSIDVTTASWALPLGQRGPILPGPEAEADPGEGGLWKLPGPLSPPLILQRPPE